MFLLAIQLTLGHVRKHALEALLCLVGIALGVAVVVGIDLAVAACVSSFANATNSLADRATHSITNLRGYLTDDEYIALLRQNLPYHFAPVIDRRVLAQTATAAPTLVHLFGIDPFSERQLRAASRVSKNNLDDATLNRFLTEPDQVILVDALAATLHAKVNDQLALTINTQHHTVNVCAVIPLEPAARAQLPDLMIVDLATAQEITGALNQIDRVDTALATPQDVATLQDKLPAGFVLRSTSDRANSLAELTAAYRLNLTALSMMASFVAVFIVYNALLVSVQQRSASLGILRCLGSSRWQLAGIYLIEALVFSFLGGVIGVLAGYGIAHLLVGFIATTINDLYAAVRPAPVTLDVATCLKGLAISLISGLLGAAIPLYQASCTPPISVLRPTDAADAARRWSSRAFSLGVFLLALSMGLFYLPTASPLIGFAMAIATAFGFALLCPLISRLICCGLAHMGRRRQSLPLQMAAGGVSRSLGITGVAVAAMMLALAMSIGIQTMVASFRGALTTWLEQRFRYDVIIATTLAVDYKVDATLDPEILLWAQKQPQTRAVISYRFRDIPLTSNGQTHITQLLSTQTADLLAVHSLVFKSSSAAAFDPAKDVLISEPLAGKLQLRPDDTLTLDTPTGLLPRHIYGIYYDFGSDRGQLILDSAIYMARYQDLAITSLHIKVQDGQDADAVAQMWQQQLTPRYPVVVHSFARVKSEVLKIFNRTFSVTDVLAWLAGAVAFCGLAGALMALALARAREYAILISLGLSRRQTAVWLLAEGLLIALTAALVACVAGTVLSFILASVIQYRSFGWSIPSSPKPIYWLQTFGLAGTAAVLASLYPLHLLKQHPPATTLRHA